MNTFEGGNQEPRPTFDSLKEAARKEDWDTVDAHIGSVLTSENMRWAEGALTDSDKNIRDLAATMFEKSDVTIEDNLRAQMYEYIRHDTHPYVRYRLAFALYKRGDRTKFVTDAMMEASVDSDVGALAKEYLTTP